jgi:general secretion pathway protein G
MQGSTSESGWTLIELLVVMVIIGLLAALVGPSIMNAGDKGRITSTKAQIANFETALDAFRLDVGRYPNSQEGLQALFERPSGADRWDGPYLKKGVPNDGWGHPYIYKSPGDKGPYEIASYGADGVAGGDKEKADLTN